MSLHEALLMLKKEERRLFLADFTPRLAGPRPITDPRLAGPRPVTGKTKKEERKIVYHP